MSDQAERLRQLVGVRRRLRGREHRPRRRAEASSAAERCTQLRQPSRRRTLAAVHERQGGVGTSNLVLNLAIALGEMEQRVLVVDGDIGLANLDLLGGLLAAARPGRRAARPVRACGCGRAGALRHPRGARSARQPDERERSGRRSRAAGPRGEGAGARLRLRADRRGLGARPGRGDSGGGGGRGGCRQHARADLGGGCSRGDRPVSPVAESRRCGCSSTRPASRAEGVEVLDGIVNASRQFKGAVVAPLGPGFVRVDPRVPMAVRSRRPFVTAFPAAAASRGVRRIAGRLSGAASAGANGTGSSGFERRLGRRWRSWSSEAGMFAVEAVHREVSAVLRMRSN